MSIVSIISLFFLLSFNAAVTKADNSSSVPPPVPVGSFNDVRIFIVIDDERIITEKRGQGKNCRNPLGLDHSYAWMMASQRYVLSGQATADLHVKVAKGSSIHWSGSSLTENADNSVLIYKMSMPPNKVIENTRMVPIYEREYVEPIQFNGDPSQFAICGKRNHLYATAKTLGAGKVAYNVQFALYERLANSSVAFFGCFQWNPVLLLHQLVIGPCFCCISL